MAVRQLSALDSGRSVDACLERFSAPGLCCVSEIGLCYADELVLLMQGGSMKLDKIQGMTLNPLSQQWGLSDDLGVNYIAAFVAA